MATTSLEHPTVNTKRMLRASDVAELLDLPVKRVHILAREGVIPRIKVGRQVRFNPIEIQAWLNEGGSDYPSEDRDAQ